MCASLSVCFLVRRTMASSTHLDIQFISVEVKAGNKQWQALAKYELIQLFRIK